MATIDLGGNTQGTTTGSVTDNSGNVVNYTTTIDGSSLESTNTLFFVGGATSDLDAIDPNLVVTFDREITDLQFNVIGLDQQTNYDDKITIRAFDSDGDPVAISATLGSNYTVTSNGSNGVLTYEANNSTTGSDPRPISFGPNVARIEANIQAGSNGTGATGTIRITDFTFTESVAICFTRDTMIDTDLGEVAVQDLATGMMVRTRDNGFQPIRWVGMTPTKDRAVRIKAGALGNTRDLVVSPRHRMVLDGWQLKMLFDHDHALVTALELVNDDTIVRDVMADVEYYHVMFDKHEVIYAEGAATESFHPDQPSMGSMDKAAREEIFALFPDLRDGAKREEAAANLSPVQAAYVGKNLDAFVG